MEIVSTAYDGIDAYSKIIQTKPDVAIIDGIMPRLDGLGVLDKINNANITPRPICIFLSSLSQEKISQRVGEKAPGEKGENGIGPGR